MRAALFALALLALPCASAAQTDLCQSPAPEQKANEALMAECRLLQEMRGINERLQRSNQQLRELGGKVEEIVKDLDQRLKAVPPK